MSRVSDVLKKISEESAKASVSSKRISKVIELGRQAQDTNYLYTVVVKPDGKDLFHLTVLGPSKTEAKKILKDILLDAGYPGSEISVA